MVVYYADRKVAKKVAKSIKGRMFFSPGKKCWYVKKPKFGLFTFI